MILPRITEYWPGAGASMIEAMATGLSLTAAAAKLGILRQTINVWEKQHERFADEMQYARALRLLSWEEDLIKIRKGEIEGANVVAAIFGLKNADPEEWRDRREPNLTIINPGQVASTEIALRIAHILTMASRGQVGDDATLIEQSDEAEEIDNDRNRRQDEVVPVRTR